MGAFVQMDIAVTGKVIINESGNIDKVLIIDGIHPVELELT